MRIRGVNPLTAPINTKGDIEYAFYRMLLFVVTESCMSELMKVCG